MPQPPRKNTSSKTNLLERTNGVQDTLIRWSKNTRNSCTYVKSQTSLVSHQRPLMKFGICTFWEQLITRLCVKSCLESSFITHQPTEDKLNRFWKNSSRSLWKFMKKHLDKLHPQACGLKKEMEFAARKYDQSIMNLN